mgnify:CR=1 FL=1
MSTKRLYVGSIPLSLGETEISELFADFSPSGVRLVLDKGTGTSRGFAFVEVPEDKAAQAIEKLNGLQLAGRFMTVDVAKEPAAKKAPATTEIQAEEAQAPAEATPQADAPEQAA